MLFKKCYFLGCFEREYRWEPAGSDVEITPKTGIDLLQCQEICQNPDSHTKMKGKECYGFTHFYDKGKCFLKTEPKLVKKWLKKNYAAILGYKDCEVGQDYCQHFYNDWTMNLADPLPA